MYIIICTGGPRQPDHKIIYPGKCTLTYTNIHYTVDSLNNGYFGAYRALSFIQALLRCFG